MSRVIVGFVAALACLSAACTETAFQHVAITTPTNARVTILEGVGTPRIETKTPFTGNFEAISLRDWSAYRVELFLDAQSAARYGATHPVTIYGRLVVGEPTEISKKLTVTLEMPDEKIAELVRGSRVEISVHVDDPNPSTPTRLAELTLRMAPF